MQGNKQARKIRNGSMQFFSLMHITRKIREFAGSEPRTPPGKSQGHQCPNPYAAAHTGSGGVWLYILYFFAVEYILQSSSGEIEDALRPTK